MPIRIRCGDVVNCGEGECVVELHVIGESLLRLRNVATGKTKFHSVDSVIEHTQMFCPQYASPAMEVIDDIVEVMTWLGREPRVEKQYPYGARITIRDQLDETTNPYLELFTKMSDSRIGCLTFGKGPPDGYADRSTVISTARFVFTVIEDDHDLTLFLLSVPNATVYRLR